MPTPITTFAAAKARLIELVQPDTEPVLTTTGGGELEIALTDHILATLWTANTAYKVGDAVQPTANNRTGRRYIVITAGTSHATTEPSWPTSEFSRVSDGTVTWEEAGVEQDLWDIRAAAEQCWLMKAAKASADISKSVGAASREKQQRYEHCREMAKNFAPVGIG